ncbi:hypothetical protein D3C72_2464140 [compost metagenome]
MPISALYPHNRHLSPKVRAFVDWVAELFEGCPLMQGEEIDGYECPEREKPAPAPAAAEPEDACLCVM